MVGATFNKIANKGMDLTDLSVGGFQNIDYFTTQYGVYGEFSITILNKNGGTARDDNDKAKFFGFYATYDDVSWSDFCWYQGDDSDPVEPGAVVFDEGEGLWFNVSPDAYVEGTEQYTLCNAGEALMDAGSVPLRDGSKGIVAPLSAGVDLTKMKISGFEDIDYFTTQYGVYGEFSITILNKNGGTERDGNDKPMFYGFYATYDDVSWSDLCWYQGDDSDPVAEGTVVFPMGYGLWVNVSPDAFPEGDEQYYLDFPGIDD